MNHRPVCVECGLEMRPEKNGVGLLDMAEFGAYQIWDADKWKCPSCGKEIIVGFGNNPVSQHFEPEFSNVIAQYQKTPGGLIKSLGG